MAKPTKKAKASKPKAKSKTTPRSKTAKRKEHAAAYGMGEKRHKAKETPLWDAVFWKGVQ